MGGLSDSSIFVDKEQGIEWASLSSSCVVGSVFKGGS